MSILSNDVVRPIASNSAVMASWNMPQTNLIKDLLSASTILSNLKIGVQNFITQVLRIIPKDTYSDGCFHNATPWSIYHVFWSHSINETILVKCIFDAEWKRKLGCVGIIWKRSYGLWIFEGGNMLTRLSHLYLGSI